jgi:hypothetical protein
MTVGLITRDASGNVLLDTTTRMFRLIGVLSIRVAWAPGSTWYNKTGSYTDPAIALGTPFFFNRPVNFNRIEQYYATQVTITTDGTTINWDWSIAISSSTPVYIEVAYGVRS